jgi:hypothetical protein
MKQPIKKAIKDYKEWRSFKVPIIDAIRMTWKYNVAIYFKATK